MIRSIRLRHLPAAGFALCGASLAHAHTGAATIAAWAPSWNFELGVSLPLLISALLYAAGHRTLLQRARSSRAILKRQALAFAAGWIALVAALLSPLDALGGALFSAHMVQHELMMIVAASLLVIGRPLLTMLWAFPARGRTLIGKAMRSGGVRGTWRFITRASVAWVLHAAALWLWHAPRLFEAALADPAIHALQHASFLGSALLFWWTIFGAHARNLNGNGNGNGNGSNGGAAMLSLFTTMAHTGALGALLTLAPALWYPSYIESATAWGFDPLQDQQLGGLVMWVPGGLAYLVGGLVVAAQRLLQRDGRPLVPGAGAGP